MPHATLPSAEPHIGPYKLLHERGEGAFARAYLAEHSADGRLVVIKVAHTWNPLVEAAFRQEFLLGSRLRHPHLGEVLDHGRSQAGRPYLVLAFDDGAELACKQGPWSEADLVRLALQLARGLGALHAQGLVHRDVAPANILVGATGLSRLIDFGMLTPAGAAGGAAGTPLYLAPEAVNGHAIDARADLYALGAVLYRQACGQAPFEELSPEMLLDAVLHVSPQPIAQRAPHLSHALGSLIMRLLSKDAADRPATAADVAAMLALDPVSQALPLAEGGWLAPDAWVAWESFAAAPGLFNFTGAPGAGLSRTMQEAFRQVRRLDLPALLLSAEELIGPYALIESIARWAAALAPEALQGLDADLRCTIAPLWPWLAVDDALERSALPLDDGGGAVAAAMSETLAVLLAGVAGSGRLALLIDNWDAADPASKALLRKGWRAELDFCHWLLASHSPVAEARSWPLASMSVETMRPWLASCLHGVEPEGLAGRLAEASGGNPGWAYQALQALHQAGRLGDFRGGSGRLIALPASLEATLEFQFGQFSLEQRSLAEVLALYGAPFSNDTLAPFASLLPIGWPLELPVLVTRGLLLVRGGTYRWATGWWPAWVRDQIPAPRAARLSKELARALEKHWLGNGEIAPSAGLLHRLAQLYERSDDDEARVRYAYAAGRACAALYANESALEHFAHGLAALEGRPELVDNESRSLAFNIGQADVRRITGELDAAANTYLVCLERVEAKHERARLLVSLGKCHQMLNQFEAARVVLEQALDLLAGTDATVERLRALTTLARVLFFEGRRAECHLRYEEALSSARAMGERTFQAEALSFLGKLMAGQSATAEAGLAYLSEALKLREALRDQLGRNDTHMLLGNAFYSQGRFKPAREHFESNRAIATKIGNRSETAFAHINLALCDYELGMYVEMLANARAALALGQTLRDEFVIGFGRYLEASGALALGDLATVETSLDLAKDCERRLGSPELRLFGLVCETERHLLMGRFGQAVRAAELAKTLVAQGVAEEMAAKVHVLVGEAWLHEGQLARADEAVAMARAVISTTGGVAPAVSVSKLAGWLAFRRSDMTGARQHWTAALALARREGLRPLEIRLLLALHLLARQDLAQRPDAQPLEAAYALAEAARSPEPLALACLGLSIHHLEEGRDLLAERVSRRGFDLLAMFTEGLSSQGDRQAFLAHPERSPFCEAREVEEAYRLQQRGRRLEMLLQLAEGLAASRDPEGVLALVRQFTLEVTAAERCFILLARGPADFRIVGDAGEGAYSQTIVQRVVATLHAECVLDTMADEGLKAQASIMDLRVRSVMCVPMVIDKVLHGVLYVDSRVALGAFTGEDLRVVEAIARQAAVAMDSARLHSLQALLIKQQKEHIARLEASDEHIRQLQAWDRAKEEAFEAESHDLRSPVASIKVAVQLLKKGNLGPISPEQAEMLDGIEYNQRALMTRIDGILDGARLAVGRLVLTRRTVALSGPVRQAMRVIAAQAAARSLDLEWDPTLLEAVRVLGDERRLADIMQNLVGNAVKFTLTGSVAVTATQAGGRVSIRIQDTGPGISPERLSALFERYGATVDTAALAGSGLGLWRVKGLVDLHEGSIEVESAPGVGTTFIIDLPAAD